MKNVAGHSNNHQEISCISVLSYVLDLQKLPKLPETRVVAIKSHKGLLFAFWHSGIFDCGRGGKYVRRNSETLLLDPPPPLQIALTETDRLVDCSH